MTHRNPTEAAPVSIAAALGRDPTTSALLSRNDMTTAKCNGVPTHDARGRVVSREPCDNVIELTEGQRMFSGPSLCCDACCERYGTLRRTKEGKAAWEHWLRMNAQRYANFSVDHAEFNARAFAVMKTTKASDNVILFGPTGTCKTFLMLLQLKRALWAGRAPMVLWSDQLKKLTRQRYNSRDLEPYENAGVLGIEEMFGEDSAREDYTSFIRNIIDVRLRLRKPTIITTQLSSKAMRGEIDKFANATTADRERVDAIMRRISEDYTAIDTNRNFDHDNNESLF